MMIRIKNLLLIIISILFFITGLILVLTEPKHIELLSYITCKATGFACIYISSQLHPFTLEKTVKKENITSMIICIIIALALFNTITYFIIVG